MVNFLNSQWYPVFQPAFTIVNTLWYVYLKMDQMLEFCHFFLPICTQSSNPKYQLKKKCISLLVKDRFVAVGADHEHGQLGHWRRCLAPGPSLTHRKSPTFTHGLDPSQNSSHFWLPRVQVLRPPSRSTVGQPVFIEVVVVAINLSLPSGLPRATKRARLGLPTLPPPIRKPRVVEGKQLERWRHGLRWPGGLAPAGGGNLGGRSQGCCRSISDLPPPRSRSHSPTPEAKHPGLAPTADWGNWRKNCGGGETFKLDQTLFNQSCMILRKAKKIGGRARHLLRSHTSNSLAPTGALVTMML